MKVLNLACLERSDIKYKIVSFSDTQRLINLLGVYEKGNTNIEESVQIVSRMSWGDVQLIICAKETLKEAGFKHIHLYVPYFLGARSDRKFQKGSINYLKKVICPIINSLCFKSVTVLDPHSNCLEMGLRRFKVADNNSLIRFAINDIYKNFYPTEHRLVLIGPDRGSYDRVVEAAISIQRTKNVHFCDKHREISTGKLLSIDIGNLVDLKGKDVFVIDDICDGGGTFLMLAEKLKLLNPGKMYLVVTHGIFSQGFCELANYFDAIYCTNSFNEINIKKALCSNQKINKVMEVKQLNVL